MDQESEKSTKPGHLSGFGLRDGMTIAELRRELSVLPGEAKIFIRMDHDGVQMAGEIRIPIEIPRGAAAK